MARESDLGPNFCRLGKWCSLEGMDVGNFELPYFEWLCRGVHGAKTLGC